MSLEHIKYMTKAQYDALVSKDANTLYFVEDNPLYRHHIHIDVIDDTDLHCDIFTHDATPFTVATLTTFMQGKHYCASGIGSPLDDDVLHFISFYGKSNSLYADYWLMGSYSESNFDYITDGEMTDTVEEV